MVGGYSPSSDNPESSSGDHRLDGRVALVTGAGRGIGRAIALALAGAGARVVAVSRTLSEVEETADMARDRSGRQALAVEADVSDERAVQGLVERTVREFGGIHVLVNNAGVLGPIGPLVENDLTEWVRTLQINLMGTCCCCKAVLPWMMRQRYGKIINLSGGGATAARPYFSAYATSKAAIVRLTETLAEEVSDLNIQVNAIAPGAVNTRLLEQVLAAGAAAGEKAVAETKRQTADGTTSPDLAAALAVYLASTDSDGLTGKLIAAPYDGWQSWDSNRIAALMSAPWFTLRRIDPFTLRAIVRLSGAVGG